MNPTAISAGYQCENNVINMSPRLYLGGTATLRYMLEDTRVHIGLIITSLFKYEKRRQIRFNSFKSDIILEIIRMI